MHNSGGVAPGFPRPPPISKAAASLSSASPTTARRSSRPPAHRRLDLNYVRVGDNVKRSYANLAREQAQSSPVPMTRWDKQPAIPIPSSPDSLRPPKKARRSISADSDRESDSPFARVSLQRVGVAPLNKADPCLTFRPNALSRVAAAYRVCQTRSRTRNSTALQSRRRRVLRHLSR